MQITLADLARAQGVVSTMLLFLVLSMLSFELYRARKAHRRLNYFRLSWMLHGAIFYVTTFFLRRGGITIEQPLWVGIITLWSSALRVHVFAWAAYGMFFESKRFIK